MDETIIRRRVSVRERARSVIALMVEEASSITPDICEAFWDEIRKSLPQSTPVALSNQPMTDEQARVFGLSPMPFGEFKGWPVHNVPLDRLEWYSDSKFQQQLVRYLNSPKMKQERDLNDLLDDEDE